MFPRWADPMVAARLHSGECLSGEWWLTVGHSVHSEVCEVHPDGEFSDISS